MAIQSINPATGEKIREFSPLSQSDLAKKVALSRVAYLKHRQTTYAERAARLVRAAEILEEEKDRWAKVMTLEMGKPIVAAREEVLKCAKCCRYYAENGANFLADRPIKTEADRSFVRYLPIGPVLAIMPWNFPFWQVFRFAAPALMAGNTGLLKHSSNVPQCALGIEEIFSRAGFGEGVFQTLLISGPEASRLIADPAIAAVTLTGSEKAGIEVGQMAGSKIKKSVLELGGSDPFLVMASADLDAAVRIAVTARTINNGQSCIAAKRFIVAESIGPEFERRFVQAMKDLRIGDPLDESVQLGPLATRQILADLEKQVKDSVAAGARLLTGGGRIDCPGNYFAPTVLTDIPVGSPAYGEEFFGPVALLFRVKDIHAAVQLANDSRFGLGSALFSQDSKEQEIFINECEAGMSFVNGMVASDPRLPFGGVKSSGYGRELGDYGIHEFVNIKTVWMKERPGALPVVEKCTE